ncbi:hypothetical protein J2S19_002834 [Metabacillus malikii]|uniref:Uncharacterized protein n=1 Tax=Metabacillus malikii TaxID=1504265 RepID=A0ABT9ZGY4_9BACI|nr:hypothetical protein [Metabacillus malikii]
MNGIKYKNITFFTVEKASYQSPIDNTSGLKLFEKLD